MKMKTFTKITSSVLSVALTMQIGWGVTTEKVNAESYETDDFLMWNYDHLDKWVDNGTAIGTSELFCYVSEDTSVLVSKSELALEVEQFATGTLGAYTTVEDGKQHRLNLQPNESVTITTITMSNSADRIFHSSGGLNCTTITNNGSHELQSGCTFSCSGTYTNNGTITLSNNDTFSCGTLSGPGTIAIGGENTTLTADTITINSGSTNKGTINVTSSLTFEGYDTSSAALGGTFVCEPNTWVSSDGATFTLKVGDVEKTITGTVDFVKAERLVLNDPAIELDSISNPYYGQDYDFTSLISVADGYDESLVYLEYSSNGLDYTTEKPISQGSYYVRAVAPADGSYYGDTSAIKHYTINYLSFRDIFPTGSKTYDSVSGIINGKYVAGDLVLKMPDGILIKGYSFGSNEDFSNAITLTPDDVLIDGHVNQDSLIQLRRESDNATTNGNISLVDVYPDINNLVYDLDDPYVDVQFVDDVEASIEDGIRTGDKVEIGIGDDNLDKIYVNGELYEYDDSEEEGWVDIELNSTPGETTDYTIKATDLAGRSTTLSFTLYPNATEPTLSVSVPETIYAGDDYEITVTTNSDATPSFRYSYFNVNKVLEGQPKTAGEYNVTVTLEETEFYTEKSSGAIYFEIIKRTPTVALSIPSVYVGDTISPILTTDSDGKSSATYEYKVKGADDDTYTSVVPEAAGEYTARVTLPATDYYTSATATATFTISKHSCTVEVTAEDTSIGVAPYMEITTLSDGKDSAVIEYKADGDPDSAYTTEIPSTTGKYVLRVTIPETEKYQSCSGTCEINFVSPPHIVISVEDIYYGDTPDPVVTNNFMYSIVEQTIEYKLVSEPDSAYSETVPTAVGKYDVRIWVAYPRYLVEATGYDTFEIRKLPVTATVKVSNIKAGETINPKVEYECTGTYTGASGTIFEYKLASADDTNYSDEKPTFPGTYVCRATLPETDTCQGTTCTTEFTISLIRATASLSINNIYVGQTPNPVLSTNSPVASEAVYEYKKAGEPDTSYSTTLPTAAGSYYVRVTIPATSFYTSATSLALFTINKWSCNVEVTANEINAGEEPDLDIETNSDALDQAIYEYREYSEPDTAFAEGYPTEAGLYVIRVTIPETDKYLSGSGTCEMQVNRNDVIATISVADIYVGETPDPVITSDSPAKNDATIEYKLASADDSAYSTTVPTAAGTYSVRASLPFTVFYKATTCETTFTISKRDVSASVSVADIVYGGTVNPVITINSEDYEAKDQVTYLYAPHDIENPAEFTGDIPTEVGEYSVMAVLPETDTYYGTEVFAIFNINRQQLNATVSVEDVFYGEEFTVNFTIQGSTTFLPNEYYYFEYKPADAADSAYTTTRPTATGNYVVRLTVLPNGYTEDGVATGTFAIKKLSPTATVSVADIYVGGTVTPVVTTVSDGKDDTMFEYKLSTAADTAYSTTVPTAAGTYTVRATVPATLINNSVTATATFTISKNPVTATVTVADITVGNNPAPVVTTVSDGVATYEYKVAGADDSTYSDTIPTAAGTYTVKATVPETAKYLATSATANFEIIKNETTATVSVANITVGNEPDPIVSTVSDGKYLATFQYKAAGADDTAYTATVPTAAGSYTVKASIPETAKYFALTATTDFTISKNVATSEVTVDDILVGGTISPVITTNSDGAKTVEYKAADADDSAYSTTLPYVEGKYTVRVTISETAKYFATSCTSDFFISKSEVGASVSVENIYVGGEVVPVVSTESNGKDDTVFEYKVAGADDSTYTYTVPSAAGTYTVRATVPATLEYTSIVCYDSFEIYLNPVTMQKFKVENYFVGQSPDPEFECSSNGDVTFEYKSKNADDSEYTTDEPTKAGIYTIRATVEETAVYASASFITDFTISYLNAPQTAFTPAGTEGKNGYFKSDVELTAPAGYKISATENGEYTDKIPYTDDLNTIYLKRDDGAKTSAITITDKPKIDKAAPTFNFSTGTVAEDSVMFIPSLVITVDDPNLKSLTLNGQPVDLTAVSGNVITLSPGWGTLEVTVVAEDIAGNISKISFILKAEWLELGTIPADQLVPLEIKTEYNLGDGKWQVIKGNPDDNSVKTEADPTVYNGGMPVYAAEGGEYTVTQVS